MPFVQGIVRAFAYYGAVQRNSQWAVSAPIEGAMVMSLWDQKFCKGMRYEDRLSRWSGPGNNLFREHLQQAIDEDLPIRLVVAYSSDPDGVNRGEDASKFTNRFAVRPEMIGKVVHFDGDEFHIAFERAKV